MRRAALVHNPAAGGGATARLRARIADELRAAFALELHASASAGHLVELARDAAREGLAALFVLGGDGSLRLAAEGLAGSATALGALPGGTTNVVARALGLPRDPVAAARALTGGATRAIDLGEAGGRPFLMQLSGGLDAEVLAAVDARWKRRVGRAAVAWAGLREWSRYGWPELALELDGERLAVTGFVAANLAEYAGPYRIAPDASPDDGRLDLLLYRGRRRRDAAGFAWALARGRHAGRAGVELRRVERLRIVGPAELRLQADGDPFRVAAPLEVGVAAARLTVLVPAAGTARVPAPAHPGERPAGAGGTIASRP